MTSKDLPPSNWGSEHETPDEFERLNQIERRLKRARPTPADFDAAAWEQMVSASEAPVMPDPETVPLAWPVRRRGLSRAAGTIAAIWLSGVVVGLSVMFLIMNREPEITRSDHPQTPGVRASRELEPRKLADLPASPEIAPTSADRLLASRTDSLAVRSMPWPVFGLDEPLRPFGNAWMEAPTSAASLPRSQNSRPRNQEPLQQSDTQRQLASSFVPPPKATPQRILEDLIADEFTFGQPL